MIARGERNWFCAKSYSAWVTVIIDNVPSEKQNSLAYIKPCECKIVSCYIFVQTWNESMISIQNNYFVHSCFSLTHMFNMLTKIFFSPWTEWR